MEKGEKNVPLQPANEETRQAGKFIKELEKAKREREKRFYEIFCEIEKKFAPLQPLRKRSGVFLGKGLKSAEEQEEREKKKAAETAKK